MDIITFPSSPASVAEADRLNAIKDDFDCHFGPSDPKRPSLVVCVPFDFVFDLVDIAEGKAHRSECAPRACRCCIGRVKYVSSILIGQRRAWFEHLAAKERAASPVRPFRSRGVLK